MRRSSFVFVFVFVFAFMLETPRALAQGKVTHGQATFVVPRGWTHETQGDIARLTQVTPGVGYCQVNIYGAAPTVGNARSDFERDWKAFAAGPFGIKGKPTPVRRPAFPGWKLASGRGSFVHGGATTRIALATYTARGKAVSIITLASHDKCEAAFASFWSNTRLLVPDERAAEPAAATPAPTSAPAPARAVRDGFQFVESNFDDGWKATVQTDWVVVEKGAIRVYLYYALPYDVSRFSGTGVMERDYYWREIVAKTFKTRQAAYRDNGEVVSSFKPPYVEGWGADPSTGDRRFVAMTLGIAPNVAMLTVATAPSEQALLQAFPKANDRWGSDLAAMSRYNKFAVGPADVLGTWQSGGSQAAHWYDSVTGAYAGATVAASSATFVFEKGGKYRSVHNGATGAVGAMSTFQQEYRGTYKVANYAITATHRFEGRTDVFDAHFQAVRGGRLLALDDRRGGSYLLVRTKR